jgi:hypothetical protein
MDYMKLGIGAALGVAYQLAANHDAKKVQEFGGDSANAAKAYPEYKRWSTWVGVGVPVLGVVAELTRALPIPRQYTDIALESGAVLLGVKAASMLTRKNYKLVYSATAYTGLGAGAYSARSPGPSQWAPATRNGASAYNVTGAKEILV